MAYKQEPVIVGQKRCWNHNNHNFEVIEIYPVEGACPNCKCKYEDGHTNDVFEFVVHFDSHII